MHILVIDIGGTNVKIWKTDEFDKLKFPSGKQLTPQQLVDDVKRITADDDKWKYDRVSIGYPGDVLNGHPSAEPWNLGNGWVDFDFAQALGCPVKIMNDACMQALGSYEGGRMLYLGLGTSMGTAFIIDKTIVPLALGHLRFRRGSSYENALCRAALKERGVSEWRRSVTEAAMTLKAAFQADYVVIGGGNAKKMDELPAGCRRGGNHNAYFGGLRMWDDGAKKAEELKEATPAVEGDVQPAPSQREEGHQNASESYTK
jgi:predicted NBD/HSP70 family sugar kinase